MSQQCEICGTSFPSLRGACPKCGHLTSTGQAADLMASGIETADTFGDAYSVADWPGRFVLAGPPVAMALYSLSASGIAMAIVQLLIGAVLGGLLLAVYSIVNVVSMSFSEGEPRLPGLLAAVAIVAVAAKFVGPFWMKWVNGELG